MPTRLALRGDKPLSPSSPCAEAAHEEDDKADQQNEAKTSAANDGPAKVKTTAAEQEKQNNHED
jgi:hypothetical protein